jgi:hypothetical protein
MKYTKVIKPGTNKSQMVETERVDFYRQYGWEPAVVEVTAKLKAPKTKTVMPIPAVEEEVGNDDIIGEQL